MVKDSKRRSSRKGVQKRVVVKSAAVSSVMKKPSQTLLSFERKGMMKPALPSKHTLKLKLKQASAGKIRWAHIAGEGARESEHRWDKWQVWQARVFIVWLVAQQQRESATYCTSPHLTVKWSALNRNRARRQQQQKKCPPGCCCCCRLTLCLQLKVYDGILSLCVLSAEKFSWKKNILEDMYRDWTVESENNTAEKKVSAGAASVKDTRRIRGNFENGTKWNRFDSIACKFSASGDLAAIEKGRKKVSSLFSPFEYSKLVCGGWSGLVWRERYWNQPSSQYVSEWLKSAAFVKKKWWKGKQAKSGKSGSPEERKEFVCVY